MIILVKDSHCFSIPKSRESKKEGGSAMKHTSGTFWIELHEILGEMILAALSEHSEFAALPLHLQIGVCKPCGSIKEVCREGRSAKEPTFGTFWTELHEISEAVYLAALSERSEFAALLLLI